MADDKSKRQQSDRENNDAEFNDTYENSDVGGAGGQAGSEYSDLEDSYNDDFYVDEKTS